MEEALNERRKRGTLRRLQHGEADPLRADNGTTSSHQGEECTRSSSTPDSSHSPRVDEIDFASNDYLGLARSVDQAVLCHDRISSVLSTMKARKPTPTSSYMSEPILGATGSRLLSGDSPAFHDLERYLATVHGREAALLFNSGYDANVSVVSSLRCDGVVFDEYAHNSLHMGIRLWKSSSNAPATERASVSFRHNSVGHLDEVLHECRQKGLNSTVVVIETVYSMDGDVAPVKAILDVCSRHGALLVVDEAHALGVFGRDRDAQPSEAPFLGTGVLAEAGVEQHPSLLCSVHTFGKAAGCHGAVVCGSRTLKSYLVNYGYPLIYSTALPLHSLIAIKCSYEVMTSRKGEGLRSTVRRLVHEFREGFRKSMGDSILVSLSETGPAGRIYLLPSSSPVQALLVPGNQRCTDFCRLLYQLSRERIRLYPIKAPTVPLGQERVRIIIHAHNTSDQVRALVTLLRDTLQAMALRPTMRADTTICIHRSKL
jgi:8-amino-7-oxononanoate synthase